MSLNMAWLHLNDRSFAGPVTAQAEAERHARAMNNAHVAAGYVTSLQQSLRRDSARVFPTQADADRLDLVLSGDE